MVESLHFSCNLPSPLLVASTLVVTPRVASTMILGLGMGCMGLCSFSKEGVLMKDCKLGGRWVVQIEVVRLGLDT